MSHQKVFERYNVDFEVCVTRIKDFMERLVRSGIDPAYVSLEGFRYTAILIQNCDVPQEAMRGDIASALLEEATKRAGIHSDQLRAKTEQKG